MPHFGMRRAGWTFAATFGIGLFFAILFERSRLWMVGIMPGIGDWFIDGLA